MRSITTLGEPGAARAMTLNWASGVLVRRMRLAGWVGRWCGPGRVAAWERAAGWGVVG
ncbi:MAG: hypothetical protein ACK5ZV_07595 [bacterium]